MNARVLVCAASLFLLSGCGPRQVEVRTAPEAAAQVSVQVVNHLAEAVNVYITSGGTDTFVRQVAANSTATAPVESFAPGTAVVMKAVTVDGEHTYTRNNVTLSGTYVFTLP